MKSGLPSLGRRQAIAALAGAPLLGMAGAQETALPITKAVLYSMLPKSMSPAEKFSLAKEAGFTAVECGTEPDQATAEEIAKAASNAGVRIHSVMNADHWKYPLSSGDPAVVERCVDGMKTSIRNAQLWGAKTVLLVPAVVNAETRYEDAWKRSQTQIRRLIPVAEKAKVIIAVEEVWNKFLLSPLEFAHYVDEFKSPWVRAYFDVGNVVISGYPQDWIRTLGPRIVKLHLKDFMFKNREAKFVGLGEGEIDWKAVYDALKAIGYRGEATVELSNTDRPGLMEISKRVDRILNGRTPVAG